MGQFPHVYTTNVKGTNEVILHLSSDKLPEIEVSPPPEFGGPEGFWNPEALFSATVSTCFILTFKAVSRAMKLNWIEINVDADAFLDKIDSQLSFTRVDIFVTLKISESGNEQAYLKAMEKAEESCLITNSIKAKVNLNPQIIIANV